MQLAIQVLMQLKHFNESFALLQLKHPYCKYSDVNETCYAQLLSRRQDIQADFQSPLASAQENRNSHSRLCNRASYNSKLCLQSTGLSLLDSVLNSCADKELPAPTNIKTKPTCLGGFWVFFRVGSHQVSILPFIVHTLKIGVSKTAKTTQHIRDICEPF